MLAEAYTQINAWHIVAAAGVAVVSHVIAGAVCFAAGRHKERLEGPAELLESVAEMAGEARADAAQIRELRHELAQAKEKIAKMRGRVADLAGRAAALAQAAEEPTERERLLSVYRG